MAFVDENGNRYLTPPYKRRGPFVRPPVQPFSLGEQLKSKMGEAVNIGLAPGAVLKPMPGQAETLAPPQAIVPPTPTMGAYVTPTQRVQHQEAVLAAAGISQAGIHDEMNAAATDYAKKRINALRAIAHKIGPEFEALLHGNDPLAVYKQASAYFTSWARQHMAEQYKAQGREIDPNTIDPRWVEAQLHERAGLGNTRLTRVYPQAGQEAVRAAAQRLLQHRLRQAASNSTFEAM